MFREPEAERSACTTGAPGRASLGDEATQACSPAPVLDIVIKLLMSIPWSRTHSQIAQLPPGSLNIYLERSAPTKESLNFDTL
eukprot:gene8051-biopygen14477